MTNPLAHGEISGTAQGFKSLVHIQRDGSLYHLGGLLLFSGHFWGHIVFIYLVLCTNSSLK
jgi:hypothetical protein